MALRVWGGVDLEWEDDDLALFGPLQAGFAVGLEAREGRERDLLFPGILPPSTQTPRAVNTQRGARERGSRQRLGLTGSRHAAAM